MFTYIRNFYAPSINLPIKIIFNKLAHPPLIFGLLEGCPSSSKVPKSSEIFNKFLGNFTIIFKSGKFFISNLSLTDHIYVYI